VKLALPPNGFQFGADQSIVMTLQNGVGRTLKQSGFDVTLQIREKLRLDCRIHRDYQF
jgi:hypothetical protein